MRDVDARALHELVGMLSLFLAMLSLLLAMPYEHRAARSVHFAMRRLRGPRIREESRACRELGPLHREPRMDADE